jgi:hypothetical protein
MRFNITLILTRALARRFQSIVTLLRTWLIGSAGMTLSLWRP